MQVCHCYYAHNIHSKYSAACMQIPSILQSTVNIFVWKLYTPETLSTNPLFLYITNSSICNLGENCYLQPKGEST